MAKAFKKILLIEDDPDQVFMYETKFEYEGLKIISALDGPTGIKLAKEEKPNLILLDIVMDEMDGMEVLRQIRVNPQTKDIPVVLLTNLVKKELIEESKELGALDYIVKAKVLPDEVVKRVKEILNK